MAVAITCAHEWRMRSNSVILLRSSSVLRSDCLLSSASINSAFRLRMRHRYYVTGVKKQKRLESIIRGVGVHPYPPDERYIVVVVFKPKTTLKTYKRPSELANGLLTPVC